jgi:photosystem II stability/assembly factor-like uncharacterized protein
MTTTPMLRRSALAIAVAALLVATTMLALRPHAEEGTSLSELAGHTHFHGLAVDRADPSRLYLATHHGVFRVGPDGIAVPVSEDRNDYMGFTPHPADPSVLYASGHPAGGGNMGFIVSRDGGKTWQQLSKGVGGPVDFHQMDVSPADPNVVYGAYQGRLQVSRDGGTTWQLVGPAPQGLIDLAASTQGPDVLYAATQEGLRKSQDGGKAWQDAYLLRKPATMMHVTSDGVVYTFLEGVGLIRTNEPSLAWQTVSADFAGRYLLHFAAVPGGERLYAVALDPQTHTQTLLASHDNGKTWAPLNAGTN